MMERTYARRGGGAEGRGVVREADSGAVLDDGVGGDGEVHVDGG